MSLALIQKLNAMLLAEMPEYRRQAAEVAEDAAKSAARIDECAAAASAFGGVSVSAG